MEEVKEPMIKFNLMKNRLSTDEEKVTKKPIRFKKGPEAHVVMEWNRANMSAFDRGRKPRQGNRYCLKCIRMDGKHAYFSWERL